MEKLKLLMKKPSDEEVEIGLKTAIASILKAADQERKKDPEYQELFKKSVTYEALLRETVFKMEKHILYACDLLKEKFNVTHINHKTLGFFLALPAIQDLLEKKIKAEEGSTCCVDKTYYILSKVLEKCIGEKSEND